MAPDDTARSGMAQLDIEEGLEARLDFGKVARIGRDGHQVVPVVLQDADSGQVLFVAYADEQAYRETLATSKAVLYSTSRARLWRKGATSGDELEVLDVAVNCEQNSLLYRVRKLGRGVCHTQAADGLARPTCYYRTVADPETLRLA